MENIEKVIELVAFTEIEVSALLDCKEAFTNVLVRLKALKESVTLNARFEGLDETEIEEIKASERAEEIKALQEEAAEAFRLRKVLQVVTEKVEMEIETATTSIESTVEFTETVVNNEVEPTEPVVEDKIECTEPVVEDEVEPAELLVEDTEKKTPKTTVKQV